MEQQPMSSVKREKIIDKIEHSLNNLSTKTSPLVEKTFRSFLARVETLDPNLLSTLSNELSEENLDRVARLLVFFGLEVIDDKILSDMIINNIKNSIDSIVAEYRVMSKNFNSGFRFDTELEKKMAYENVRFANKGSERLVKLDTIPRYQRRSRNWEPKPPKVVPAPSSPTNELLPL